MVLSCCDKYLATLCQQLLSLAISQKKKQACLFLGTPTKPVSSVQDPLFDSCILFFLGVVLAHPLQFFCVLRIFSEIVGILVSWQLPTYIPEFSLESLNFYKPSTS